ncbi:hypothetical protein DOS84_09200 [Flavobacterium aquariorum]|uniref:Uncharacterized protein n=1 Tax=Flavobacterium aquariorum TaxID=2217670 RepID=A0A2W7UJL2_9FLAO|nr:hypothetical protein DOS84_09200 [Flavobacterium aquariorum]
MPKNEFNLRIFVILCKNETQIFLDFSVKELKKSLQFFTELVLLLDPKFTNDKGACIIIGTKVLPLRR